MLFEIILTISIFFISKYIIYRVTEKGMPEWLNYQPYICRKCFTFWSLLFLYINIFIVSNYTSWYILIVGILLTILDTIALHIAENNTISINDI